MWKIKLGNIEWISIIIFKRLNIFNKKIVHWISINSNC